MSWRKSGLIGTVCALIATAAHSQPEVVYDSEGFESFPVASIDGQSVGSWSPHLNPIGGWSVPTVPNNVVIEEVEGPHGKVLKFKSGESAKLELGWKGYGTTGSTADQPQVITLEFDILMNDVGSFTAKTFRSASAEPNAQEIEFGSHKEGSPTWDQVLDAKLRLEDPEAPVASFTLLDDLTYAWHELKVTIYHAFPPDTQTQNFPSYHSMVFFELDGNVLKGDDVLYSQWEAWAGHLYSIRFDATSINPNGRLWLDNLKVTWDEWRLPQDVSVVGAWDPEPAELEWGNLLFDRNLSLLRLNAGDPGLMMLRRVFFYGGVNWQTWTDAMNDQEYEEELPYDDYFPAFLLPHEAYPGLHLRADYAQCWKATSEVAKLLIDSDRIFGFHLGDEPVWNGADVLDLADMASEIKNSVYGFPASTIYWLDSHRVFHHNFLLGDPPGLHEGTWINRTGITHPAKFLDPDLGEYIFIVGNWQHRAYGLNEIESRSPTGNGLDGWKIPEDIDWITTYWYQLTPDEFHHLQEYYGDQLYKKMGYANQRVLLTPGNVIGFDPLDPGSAGVAGSPNLDDQRHTMRHMARHLLWATRGDSYGGTTGGVTQPIIGMAPWLWKDRYEYSNGACATGCKYHDPNVNQQWGVNHGFFGLQGVAEYRAQFESYGRAIDENYVPSAPSPPPALPDLVQGFEVFGDGESLPSIYEWDVDTYPPFAPPANQAQFRKVDGNTIIRMDRAVTVPKFRYAWGTQPRLGWNSWDGHAIQTAQFDVYVPRCYADCDQSTGAGTLDSLDEVCWLDAFANADPYACDLDTSTGLGVCDSSDQAAFDNLSIAGCAAEETLSFDVTLFRGKERPGRIAFTRGSNNSTDMYFSWGTWLDPNVNWVWETQPLWEMPEISPFEPTTPTPGNATAKLHEGWNTVRLEVKIGDFKVNDPRDNRIVVYLDDVAVGWYHFAHLDQRVHKDRDCVFTSLGFRLWGAGTSRSEGLDLMKEELWLDNIGIWAPDQL